VFPGVVTGLALDNLSDKSARLNFRDAYDEMSFASAFLMGGGEGGDYNRFPALIPRRTDWWSKVISEILGHGSSSPPHAIHI